MVDDALGKGYSKRGERSKGVPIMAAEGEFSESEPREGQLHGEEEGGEVRHGGRRGQGANNSQNRRRVHDACAPPREPVWIWRPILLHVQTSEAPAIHVNGTNCTKFYSSYNHPKIISNSERTHPLPNENVEKRRQERAASDTNATVVVNKGGGIQVKLRRHKRVDGWITRDNCVDSGIRWAQMGK